MKTLKKKTEQRQEIEILCMDMMAPKEHILRKIDAAADFSHICPLCKAAKRTAAIARFCAADGWRDAAFRRLIIHISI